MDPKQIANKISKFTTDNSPLLLTVVGTAGVITTGILAAKGGIKAEQMVQEHLYTASESYNETVTAKEKLLLTWKCYLPAAGATVLTCGAIIGANRIGTRRAAALAVGYTALEKGFEEYREKIKEKLSPAKEQGIRDEIAQDRFNRVGGGSEIVVMADKSLCFDTFSGRTFVSTMEDVKWAINKINYQLLHEDYASVTDFYNLIGLDRTGISDDFGWRNDREFECELTSVLTADGKPAIAITFRTEPIRDYFRMR